MWTAIVVQIKFLKNAVHYVSQHATKSCRLFVLKSAFSVVSAKMDLSRMSWITNAYCRTSVEAVLRTKLPLKEIHSVRHVQQLVQNVSLEFSRLCVSCCDDEVHSNFIIAFFIQLLAKCYCREGWAREAENSKCIEIKNCPVRGWEQQIRLKCWINWFRY